MGMHWRWKHTGASNNTMLVVECDGPLDPERLRSALERFLDVCPWPVSRLRRPFPWGALHWAAGPRIARDRPSVRHHVVTTPEELQRQLEAELNAGIDPRRHPPVRFVVLDKEPGALLVMTWFHPLMDPRGGQNLLMHLADLDACDGRAPWQAPPAFVPAPDVRPLRERGRLARRSLQYMRALAPVSPVSPGATLLAPGPVRFQQESFIERDLSPGGTRATREIAWRLAVGGKAMAELWSKRGLPDVPFLLPISVDLRAKGEAGPTFGNLLAFHFARFEASETSNVRGLARKLRRQMTEAARDGQIDANAVAMEFLKYRPLGTILRTLPWTSSGEVFSFYCADIVEFPTRDRFFGRRVVNAYHVPCVLPRPGLGVFFNRCSGRNNLVVARVEGAVNAEEASRIVEVVREGMGWIAKP
jgi:hypothetical protein